MAETEQLVIAGNEPAQGPEKPRTKGERWFDFIFYGPVNIVGTFILSAVLGVVHQHRWGAHYDNIVARMKKIGFGEHFSDSFIPSFIISWGGTLMLFPLKWAENCKLGIVNTLNRWMGDRAATTEELNDKPKQTWGSLLLGRFGAMALVWTSMHTAGKYFGNAFDRAQERSGNAIARWLGKPSYKIPSSDLLARRKELRPLVTGKNVLPALKEEFKQVSKTLEGRETVHYTLGKMLVLDVFATIAAAGLLYVISKFFAKKTQHRKTGNFDGLDGQSVSAALPEATKHIDTPGRDEAPDKPSPEIMASSATMDKARVAAPTISL